MTRLHYGPPFTASERRHGALEVAVVPFEPYARAPEPSVEPEQHPPLAPEHLSLSDTVPQVTPQPSPASCRASRQTESGCKSKRVGFCPWTTSSDMSDLSTSIRSLPPSRECQSSKSILNLRRRLVPLQEDIAGRRADPASILESSLRQLTATDHYTKLDAYSILNSLLQHHPGLLDRPGRRGTVQDLLAIIIDDMDQNVDGATEPAKTNLILQALKVLKMLAWSRKLTSYFTTCQGAFLVDHSTRVFEACRAPKSVVLQYLHFLATQEFGNRVITQTRAARLLEALNDLSRHVRGKGIDSERLRVFQRILEQAKGAFKSRPSCWLGHLLPALTSPIASTRTRAGKLGHRAAVLLGPLPTVARSLRKLLDAARKNDSIYERLIHMLEQNDEARHVPQAWAVVTLLLKGLDAEFRQWTHLDDWLQIIQKCFDSNSSEVRIEANKAWNKLMYVAQLDTNTASFLSKMLIKTMLLQLQRPIRDSHFKSTNDLVFANYCNLLYYTVRPRATFDHYDSVWECHITPVLMGPFLSDEQNSDRACRIVMSLCWRPDRAIWCESRALEDGVVEPEDISLLDCKWIRSRVSSVLDLFKKLFRHSSWCPTSCPANSFVAVAWRNFAKALREAARMEIIISVQTREAVRSVSEFLVDLCRNGPDSIKGAAEDFASRFHLIVKTLLVELAPLPFADDFVPSAMDPSAASWSSKSGCNRLVLVHNVLKSLQEAPTEFPPEVFKNLVIDLLQVGGEFHVSSASRVRFWTQCAKTMSTAEKPHEARPAITWTTISELVCGVISSIEADTCCDVDMQDFLAHIGQLLEQGVPYQEGRYNAWADLAQQLSLLAFGTSEPSLSVIQRLTACLRCTTSARGRYCTAMLLQGFLTALRTPDTQQFTTMRTVGTEALVEEARPWYDEMVALLNFHLLRAYEDRDTCKQESLGALLDATISLLGSSLPKCRLRGLKGMEESLATWLLDEAWLTNRESLLEHQRSGSAMKLHSAIIDVLRDLSTIIELKSFDRLFSSAFKTCHEKDLRAMVEMWNASYGGKEDLDCGDMLQKALTRLGPFIYLRMPDILGRESHKRVGTLADYLKTCKVGSRMADSAATRLVTKTDQVASLRPSPPRASDHDLVNKYSVDASRSRHPSRKADLSRDDPQSPLIVIDSPPGLGEDSQCRNLSLGQTEARGRQDRDANLLLSAFQSRPTSKRRMGKKREEKASDPTVGGPVDCVKAKDPSASNVSTTRRVDALDHIHAWPRPKSRRGPLRLEDVEVPLSIRSNPGASAKAEVISDAQVSSTCQNQASASGLEYGSTTYMSDHSLIPECPSVGKSLAQRSQHAEDLKSNSEPMTKSEEVRDPTPQAHLAEEAPRCADEASLIRPMLSVDGRCSSAESTSVAAPTQDAAGAKEKTLGGRYSSHPRRGSATVGSGSVSSDNILGGVVTRSGLWTGRSSAKDVDNDPLPATNTGDGSGPISGEEVDLLSASQLLYDLEMAANSASCAQTLQQVSPNGSALGKRNKPQLASSRPKRRRSSNSCLTGNDNLGTRCSATLSRSVDTESQAGSVMPVESVWPVCLSPVCDARPAVEDGSDQQRGSGREFDGLSAASDTSRSERRATSRFQKARPEIEVQIPGPGQRRGLRTCSDRPAGRQNCNLTATSAVHQDLGNGEPKEQEETTAVGAAMDLLYQALPILRNSWMDQFELRTMDDLVFEIRTEAQNATRRQQRSDTGG